MDSTSFCGTTRYAPVKKKMSNFCEPLLQIRWQLPFCHFSSPKSPTCSCETESIITDAVRCSVRQCEQLSLRTTLKYRSQTRNVLMHLGLQHWSPGWSEALINVITELLFDRSKRKKGLLLSHDIIRLLLTGTIYLQICDRWVTSCTSNNWPLSSVLSFMYLKDHFFLIVLSQLVLSSFIHGTNFICLPVFVLQLLCAVMTLCHSYLWIIA